MPGVDGVSATREIVGEELADVLVLTSYSDAERIVGALDAGAVGYLLKDAEPDDMLRGIRAVARGESPIHPRAARELLGARRTTARRPPSSRRASARCWRWCARAWPTSRSPGGWASPSGP